MNSAVKAAYERVHEAQQLRDKVVQETYAPGDVVAYSHGAREIVAAVIRHGYSGDVFVEGLSGKRYWISAARFTV